LTSLATIGPAPHARATAIENSPMGPQPGDQRRAARDLPREHGVDRVAERLERGRDLERHALGHRPAVARRHGDEFGERARAVDAEDLHALAHVHEPAAAEVAQPARDVGLDRDDVAERDALGARPERTTSPTNSCPKTSGVLMRPCDQRSQP
jgi:hypothetical protein